MKRPIASLWKLLLKQRGIMIDCLIGYQRLIVIPLLEQPIICDPLFKKLCHLQIDFLWFASIEEMEHHLDVWLTHSAEDVIVFIG